MKNVLFGIVVIMISVNLGVAQKKDGIKFKAYMDWEQIFEKAKSENKYVFIDCYATWCGPCKYMDANVFTNDSLGDYMNQHFVCVRIQMDSSKSVIEGHRGSYVKARQMMRQYNINVYPSFLFFSSDGKLVHRGVGAQEVGAFYTLAVNSITKERQYYTLLERYQNGTIDFMSMPYLARVAKSIGETDLGNKIGGDFVDGYLLSLSKNRLFTKENLNLFMELLPSSRDSGFAILNEYLNRIDSILGENSAERKIMNLIGSEEVTPYTRGDKNRIDWSQMEMRIDNKFGDLGELEYREQRLGFAWINKDWNAFGIFYVLYFDKAGPLNVFHINNASWNIFLHVDDPVILAFAAREMKYDIQIYDNIYPVAFDTYANLLYKLGDKRECIVWEQKAVELEEHAANIEKRDRDDVYQKTLNKMKNGEPTWVMVGSSK